MSMWWAGYHGTAFVMNKGEFDTVLDWYRATNHSEEDWDPFEDDDDLCFKNGFGKDIVVTRISNDRCDGMRLIPFLNKDGKPNIYIPGRDERHPKQVTDILCLRGDDCYVIFTERDTSWPEMFQNPYKSYEEIREEFKEKLSEFFPKDFDWNSHIGDFSYACYA